MNNKLINDKKNRFEYNKFYTKKFYKNLIFSILDRIWIWTGSGSTFPRSAGSKSKWSGYETQRSISY